VNEENLRVTLYKTHVHWHKTTKWDVDW